MNLAHGRRGARGESGLLAERAVARIRRHPESDRHVAVDLAIKIRLGLAGGHEGRVAVIGQPEIRVILHTEGTQLRDGLILRGAAGMIVAVAVAGLVDHQDHQPLDVRIRIADLQPAVGLQREQAGDQVHRAGRVAAGGVLVGAVKTDAVDVGRKPIVQGKIGPGQGLVELQTLHDHQHLVGALLQKRQVRRAVGRPADEVSRG